MNTSSLGHPTTRAQRALDTFRHSRTRRVRAQLAALLCAVLAAVGATAEENLLEGVAPPRIDAWDTHPETGDNPIRHFATDEAIWIEVGTDAEQRFWTLHQGGPTDGSALRFEGETFCSLQGEGKGAIISIWFVDEEGERIVTSDGYHVRGLGRDDPEDPAAWTRHLVFGAPPENAVGWSIRILLHGHGRAGFRNLRLTKVTRPVDIRVAETPLEQPLIGFGFEDDGWFYNQHNARMGVDEAAIELRERRIAWLEPDWVRTFFWYKDFCPSVDGETFDWDTDNMQSHYRTLDVYEQMGVPVTICGVEWTLDHMWDTPENVARMAVALIEHLKVTKGYTCVQGWTLTNEPNLFYSMTLNQPFSKYVAVHERVMTLLQERGLDVEVVGSDDGDGYEWLDVCVRHPEYRALTDRFASHLYLNAARVRLAREILGARVEHVQRHAPGKPLIIAEFGLRDERTLPPARNPFMEEYAYATGSAGVFIDGLNVGIAGFSTWCLQEKYYPGATEPMNFGMWNYGDRGWSVRPIYHATGVFTRRCKAGMRVYPATTEAPETVEAVRAGETLFWVNLDNAPVTVAVQGMPITAARAYTEANVHTDDSEGDPLEVANQEITLPPNSFGWAE